MFALTNGFLDKIQVEDILTFQDGLFSYFDGSHKDLLDEIATTGQLPDTDKLKAAVQNFLIPSKVQQVQKKMLKLPNKIVRKDGE